MTLLEFKDVCLSYRNGKKIIPALEKINFSVSPGEFVAVLGASGCGKSSLLKLTAGVLPATAGHVLFRGEALPRKHTNRVMMFQDELLSGMQQKAAFARTLACNPDIVLMDEPFVALDALTKRNMLQFLASLWRDSGKTFLLVTHDIDEAIFLATRILVMSPRPGKIISDLKVGVRPDREALGEAVYSLLT